MPGDPPLSLKEVKQAKLTAKYLSQFPVKAVFSSPLERTKQTAAEIGKFFKIPVSPTPLLRERVNWGDDPKQSFAEFLEMLKKSSMKRNWQPPIGDSSFQAGRRLESFIGSLDLHPSEHIVLVSHGGIIADFLRNVFDDSYLNLHMPGFSSSLDENIKDCSITILEKDEIGKLKLSALAFTDHLSQTNHFLP